MRLPEKFQAATNDSDVCGWFAFGVSHTMTLASLRLLLVATYTWKDTQQDKIVCDDERGE